MKNHGPILLIITEINILPDAVVAGSASVVDVVVGAFVVGVDVTFIVRVVVGFNPVVAVDGPDDACVVNVVADRGFNV